ncbi:SH3 domain-containing protein [Desertifilum tharense IPPAS B-1220]|nr:SH3 domain-containing protein [Desertifilum tharense]MCD8485758.1 SH3 domain-containing protein [Desertifilum sp.]MDI9637861.1 SH3 domain-containing protein [Geitlerinema splendidum]
MSQNNQIAGLAIPVGIASLCFSPIFACGSFTAWAGLPEQPAALTAQSSQPNPSLVGQCRAASRSTFIYNERSPNSTRVRSLLVDEQVRLADNGLNGWIAIDQPISGFIQTNDLKPCGDPLEGQCRATNRDTFIYDSPSTNATRTRSLLPNETVTLASGGAEGWVMIRSPIQGYVQAATLRPCAPNAVRPNPPVATNPLQCRRVTEFVGEGLNVRVRPLLLARSIGVLLPGDIVRLRSNPPATNVDSEGRTWVEVTSPIPGWVSQGFIEGRNLEPVECP